MQEHSWLRYYPWLYQDFSMNFILTLTQKVLFIPTAITEQYVRGIFMVIVSRVPFSHIAVQ